VRKVFAIVASLFALSTVLQIYFAAVGVFSPEGEDLFNIHGTNGRIVLPILGILTIVAAILAKAGRRTVVFAIIALVLIAMQTVLVNLAGTVFGVTEDSRSNIPPAATFLLGFHGLNGLAIIFVSGVVLVRAWVAAFPRKRTTKTAIGRWLDGGDGE
jgi:uncharacterized membrane protein (Fun14 family)